MSRPVKCVHFLMGDTIFEWIEAAAKLRRIVSVQLLNCHCLKMEVQSSPLVGWICERKLFLKVLPEIPVRPNSDYFLAKK